MANHVQILRKIGACENRQAQPDWQGPEITPCPAPPAFLCETCGRLLCGGHAGGHWHEASDTSAIVSHFQEECAAACKREEAAKANAADLAQQLATAQAAAGKLKAIQQLVAGS
ncbi:MAG TPA: hypothetical protein VMV31_02775 [Terriglobales bacterium]|nr:hypothetical protein [Terriglobales bacterium]